MEGVAVIDRPLKFGYLNTSQRKTKGREDNGSTHLLKYTCPAVGVRC